MRRSESWLVPDWPAPARVRAISTTRQGGFSAAPYDSLNFGDHVGDTVDCVQKNRQWLIQTLQLKRTPLWLRQVHGTDIAQYQAHAAGCEADAALSTHTAEPCVVMTADCLPVLLCDRAGSVVAVAHAGWRGLLNGVIESTVDAMRRDGAEVLAWLGPAIGPQHFEVGDEVYQAFVAARPESGAAFRAGRAGHWYADIFELAREALLRRGVTAVYGGGVCTYADKARFFSFRRDGVTGRMASMIWLAED
ncbi:MAG: peptidoglycan editing factor PgeF [Gammaproteobacteria bacterium]|nr:peptidoglycan editing factor PgeF [Gammaproteobacteria bacterium]